RLVSEGLLEFDGHNFVSVHPLSGTEIAPLLVEGDHVFEGDRIFLDYVIAFGTDLVDTLQGRKSALETLFPDGSFARAEDVYERAPLAAYFGALARAALEGFLSPGGVKALNVLEIGAGTGATTSALLPALPAQTASYHFTDVSDIFLNRAERK